MFVCCQSDWIDINHASFSFFTMLIITSEVMLAELYHCMTIIPDCRPLSVSFKCLFCFYNSLHLLTCDCEDLVPTQESKGTSLSPPVLESWA